MKAARTDKQIPVSSKKRWIMLIAVILLGIAIVAAFVLIPILRDFRPLVVTLDNRSGAELVSVELFIPDQEDRYLYDEQIPSGGSSSIRPKLDLQGEGSLQLEATDAQGRTYSGMICGYTETLSGALTVIIGEAGQITAVGECR